MERFFIKLNRSEGRKEMNGSRMCWYKWCVSSSIAFLSPLTIPQSASYTDVRGWRNLWFRLFYLDVVKIKKTFDFSVPDVLQWPFLKKKIWTELKGGISRLRPRDWEERNRYLIFQILVLNKQEIKMFPLIVCNVDALPFNVNMRAREVLINHIGLRLWWRAFFQDSWHGWIIFLLKCENNTGFLLSFTLDWYVKYYSSQMT